MAKYLVRWAIGAAGTPTDPNERGNAWLALMKIVEKDVKSGLIRDWGAIPAEGKGYFVFEGTNLQLMEMTQQYTPAVLFKVSPVVTIEETSEMLSKMAE
jgi:hypothetical protein